MASYRGVISTHSLAEPGYPFGSIVPFCLDAHGLPILLLSPLAQHCRNLAADPRCALTVHDAEPDDVQRSARLTCLADGAPLPTEDAAAARRYLRYFPHTRGYFESLGFRFYRLIPRRFHFNGGFATARWLGTERVLCGPGFDEATEAGLIEQVERQHPLILETCVRAAPASQEPVRVAGIDPWGLDLRRGERLRRRHFPQPIATAADVDAFLRALA
jgi:putative heme iron utilization protein